MYSVDPVQKQGKLWVGLTRVNFCLCTPVVHAASYGSPCWHKDVDVCIMIYDTPSSCCWHVYR